MAINKVEVNGETQLDLTHDSVTPETLLPGVTAHAADGNAISGKAPVVRYDSAQNLTSSQKKQACNNIGAAENGGAVQGSQIRSFINTFGTSSDSVSISQAINGIGFATFNGATVKIYYNDYEFPFSVSNLRKLFDGKVTTNINFPSPDGADGLWNSTIQYSAGAIVKSSDTLWYRALKENTGVNPKTDDGTTWESKSLTTGGAFDKYLDLSDITISIDIASLNNNIQGENTLSIYWRASQQNAKYVKIEKYGDNVGWFTVYEKDNIDANDIITSVYLARDPTNAGEQHRLRISFRSRSGEPFVAINQIAISGLVGGIDGTLLSRGGGTLYGSIMPNVSGGASLGSEAQKWSEVRALALYGEASDTTANFSTVTARNNLASGEKLSVIFGKIAKWLADLQGLAFKDKAEKGDLSDEVQKSLVKADAALPAETITPVDGILKSNGNGTFSAAETSEASVVSAETWVFTLADGSTVTKKIPVV